MLNKILSFIKPTPETESSKWLLEQQVSRYYYGKQIYSYYARKKIVVDDNSYFLKGYLKFNSSDDLIYANITFGDLTFHEETGAVEGFNDNFIAQNFDALIWPCENKFLKSLENLLIAYSRTL